MSKAAPPETPTPSAAGTLHEHDGVGTVHKALAVLEIVAERNGATAREVSDVLGFPIPTVYRLLQELVHNDYLVHMKGDGRFELGYKLHGLGVSLHRQIQVPLPLRDAVTALHKAAAAAAYFAVYRGADVVVTCVSDCNDHPRLVPLAFGFHEAAHATAFGKIMLTGMTAERREEYLHVHPLAPLTAATITRPVELEEQLASVATRGVAWEREEFVPGMTCAAVGVHNAMGLTVGSVAVSGEAGSLAGREHEIERLLREYSGQVSRYFRSGATTPI